MIERSGGWFGPVASNTASIRLRSSSPRDGGRGFFPFCFPCNLGLFPPSIQTAERKNISRDRRKIGRARVVGELPSPSGATGTKRNGQKRSSGEERGVPGRTHSHTPWKPGSDLDLDFLCIGKEKIGQEGKVKGAWEWDCNDTVTEWRGERSVGPKWTQFAPGKKINNSQK